MPDPRTNERELLHTKVLAAPPAVWWEPDGFSSSTRSSCLRPGRFAALLDLILSTPAGTPSHC